MNEQRLFRNLIRRSLSVVGVDIGAGFIKAAEISFAGKKPVLKAAGITGIPGDFIKEGRIADIKALPTLLKKIWVDSALTCRDVVSAIDARLVFAREISLPAMSPDELKIAVKYDMVKYVPYEENSYYYDFDIIEANSKPSGETGLECRVFLAAAPVKIVDDIYQSLSEANLRVWAVDVEALAMAAVGNEWDGVNMIVDIGCFHSQIIIFSESVPVMTRIIPWGGRKFTELIMEEFGLDFEEAEAFKLDRTESRFNQKLADSDFWQKETRLDKAFEQLNLELTDEIRRTIDYFLPKRQDAIKNIYLTGGGANLKNFSGSIESGLGKIPVKMLNPLAKLDISPDIDKKYLNKLAPQLTVAVGLALRGGRYDSD